MRRLAFLLAIAFCATTLKAGSKTGTSNSSLLGMRQGVRAAGMGDAYTAVSGDINSVFNNPAGLARLDKIEATMSQRQEFSDMRQGHVLVGVPVGSAVSSSNVRHFGVFAFGIEYLNYGNFTGRTATGLPGSDFSADDHLFTLGWAKPFGQRITFGATGKMYRLSLDDKKANGVLADVGTQFNLWEEYLVAGLSVSNLGGQVHFVSKHDPAPVHGNAGLAYRPWGDRLTLAGEVEMPREQTPQIKGGLEWWPNKVLALRTGYNSTYADAGLGLTAGIGIAITDMEVAYFPIAKLMFDYAFTPMRDVDSIHQFGLTLRVDSL